MDAVRAADKHAPTPRRNLRAPVRLPTLVIVEQDGTRHDQFDAATIDLSAGGAGLACDRYLPLDAARGLAVYLDEGPVVLRGVVRNRRREEQGGWRYGIRFCSWPDGARGKLTRQMLRALA